MSVNLFLEKLLPGIEFELKTYLNDAMPTHEMLMVTQHKVNHLLFKMRALHDKDAALQRLVEKMNKPEGG